MPSDLMSIRAGQANISPTKASVAQGTQMTLLQVSAQCFQRLSAPRTMQMPQIFSMAGLNCFGSEDQSHQVRIPSQCLGFVRQREADQKQTCILDYSAVNWMGNSEGSCGGNNDDTRALTTPISILRTVSLGVI